MHFLEGINALLELDIVGRQLGLGNRFQSKSFASERAAQPERFDLRSGMSRNDRTLSSAAPSCSFTYCCVRAAKGVKEAL